MHSASAEHTFVRHDRLVKPRERLHLGSPELRQMHMTLKYLLYAGACASAAAEAYLLPCVAQGRPSGLPEEPSPELGGF